MRLLGSFAALDPVFLAFMPDILAQNDLRRAASFVVFGFGAGGFRFIPSALADARPLAFKPPLGFLPSFLVHAGDLATEHRYLSNFGQRQHGKVVYTATRSQDALRRHKKTIRKRSSACRCVQLQQRNARRAIQVELN